MRNVQWHLNQKGVWELNALPYLLCEVEALGPFNAKTNEQCFRITIIAAATIEHNHVFPSFKEAKRYARHIIVDWCTTTSDLITRDMRAAVLST